MKRILIVAPQPFFSVRGTPINVRALTSDLSSFGYEVEILTLPFGTEVEGLKISRVPRLPFFSKVPIGPSLAKGSYLLSFCLAVWRRRKRFDLLHGVEEGAFAVGLVGLLAKVPYVVDVDSCMPTQLAASPIGRIPGLTALLSTIESFFLRRAAAAITVCSALSQKVKAVAPQTPLFQIEDFPLEDALTVDLEVLGRLRQRFAGRRVALYTGNLEPYQGVELLIDSFREIQRSDVTLVIVGGDPERITRLRKSVLGLSVELEGSRPTSEMASYMELADFLVSPRLQGENVPLKLYTYMAAGKPLVATRIASHTQVVDESSAFLGEPTKTGLRSALEIAFQASPDELTAKRDKALTLVQEHYSREAFRAKVANAFQALLPLDQNATNG